MKQLLKNDSRTLIRMQTVLFLVLLYWEILLYYQLHATIKGISLFNILFMMPIAAGLSVLTGFFGSHDKANETLLVLLLMGVSVFYLGNLIYYKIFGSLVSVSMLGAGEDAITNFWWSLKTTIKENGFVIFLFELPILLQAVHAFSHKQKQGFGALSHAGALVVTVVLWCLIVLSLPLSGKSDYSAYGAYHSRYIDTDSASKKLGVLPNFLVELRYSIFGSDAASQVLQETEDVVMEEEVPLPEEVKRVFNGYEDLDFEILANGNDDEPSKNLLNYLDKLSPTTRNEYTGLFEGYNLIYICAESFSNLAIDETITPTLYKMANNGIVLKNYYNSFRNTTTNGEYAFLSGLWPDVARKETNMGKITGTMGHSIGKDMTPALGNMFRLSEEIQPRAYHNYLGYYYGRNQTLPNMGFECKFMNDGMRFTTAWPASDLEMMEQSVDDYVNDERFCAYYMTFSGHGNYTTDNVMVARNIHTVTSLLPSHLPTSAEGYLAANYELEKAMTYLLQRLEEAGKLENTVIVLTGDHYPYYLTDAGYEALKGEAVDEDFESYHSTCIIYNASIRKPIITDTPCCNVDILPTIYNLFNIRYDSRLYAGCDIFSSATHIAQIYNRNFITEKVKYNASTGEAEWLIDTEKYSKELLDNYLNNVIATVNNRYAYSVGVEETSLYDYIFDHFDVTSMMLREKEEERIAQENRDLLNEETKETLG